MFEPLVGPETPEFWGFLNDALSPKPHSAEPDRLLRKKWGEVRTPQFLLWNMDTFGGV